MKKNLLMTLLIQLHLFPLGLKDKVIKWLVHLPKQKITKRL